MVSSPDTLNLHRRCFALYLSYLIWQRQICTLMEFQIRCGVIYSDCSAPWNKFSSPHPPRKVNCKCNDAGNRIIKSSERLKKSRFVCPGANDTSYRRRTSAVTRLNSIMASCLPGHAYGPWMRSEACNGTRCSGDASHQSGKEWEAIGSLLARVLWSNARGGILQAAQMSVYLTYVIHYVHQMSCFE